MLRSLTLMIMFCIPAVGRAEPSLADREFDAAKALGEAGKFADACPHFEASYRADPALGSLLNLADCNEKVGKLATAASLFEQARDMASIGRDDREAFARERLAALEPRISRLEIRVTTVEGLTVLRDGLDVSATIGTAMTIDPGRYHVVAQAPGYRSWSTDVEVRGPGLVAVDVPALVRIEDLRLQPVPELPDATPHSDHKKLYAITLGASALAAAAVAIGLEVSARSAYADSEQATTQDELDRYYDTASSRRTMANTFGVASVVLAGSAAYCWFTRAPDTNRTHVAPAATAQLVGVAVSGRF